MEAIANLNGTLMPVSECKVSVLDRGFLFGDGIYEVLHVVDGQARFLDRHLARLERSLSSIHISGIDLVELRNRIVFTITASEFDEALVYVQITRGAAKARAHAFPPAGTPPTILITLDVFHDPYGALREKGVKVSLQKDVRWHRCDVKSVNLLGNVLAYQAAKDIGAYEAILVRPDGTITEGARTSLFGVVNGTIRTGPLSGEILPGVTRSVVLEIIEKLKLPLEERHLHESELRKCSELFLTGTTAEVLPIIAVDELSIGEGKPGPIAKQLWEELKRFPK